MTIRDVLMGCVMTGNGRQTFTGLFNENGFPVKVMLRKDDDEVILSIVYDDDDEKEKNDQPRDCGISEEEIDKVCQEQEDCDNCPLCDYCNDVFGEEDDDDSDDTGCPERAGYKEEMRC